MVMFDYMQSKLLGDGNRLMGNTRKIVEFVLILRIYA